MASLLLVGLPLITPDLNVFVAEAPVVTPFGEAPESGEKARPAARSAAAMASAASSRRGVAKDR